MKPAPGLKNMLLQAAYAVYIFLLIKIILLKFGQLDPGFLWQQLLQAPDNLRRLLHWGNFMPLSTISASLQDASLHAMVNLIGNIALFIPFGILQLLLAGGRRLTMRQILLRSLGLSLLLECAQGLFSIGTVDVDDLLLNTFGGLLGYSIFRLFPQRGKEHASTSA